ncbi:hypothetical protein TURU_021422 [Turdus rufiventris]|nr:hypothetical protein TURU_021422 [Turdus rufiventris]
MKKKKRKKNKRREEKTREHLPLKILYQAASSAQDSVPGCSLCLCPGFCTRLQPLPRTLYQAASWGSQGLASGAASNQDFAAIWDSMLKSFSRDLNIWDSLPFETDVPLQSTAL